MTLYILLDGAEDHPVPEFNGKKPLEVADMPFFRSVGRYRGTTNGKGYTHLFLNEFFTGSPPTAPRAVIEALGLGMDVQNGRTAYRLSPARIQDGMINWEYDLEDVHEGLTEVVKDNMHILDHLDPEINFFLSGRAILTMECDTVPDLPSPPVPAPFVRVPGELGEFICSIAKELHGLTEYPWGCGRMPAVIHPPLIEKMDAISNTPTALGVCRSLGHRIHHVTDLEERIRLASQLSKEGDVFLHIDEIDEYSHQRNPSKKVRILEETDSLLSKYFSDEKIVFFVDHGTSSVTGEHILMDVPFWTTFDCGMGNRITPLDQVIPNVLRHTDD